MTPLQVAAYQEARDWGLSAADAVRFLGMSRRAGQRVAGALRSAGWSPPRRMPKRAGCKPGSRSGRIEDYQWLIRHGADKAAAATRVGVSLRTIQRYDAALRTNQPTRGRTAA